MATDPVIVVDARRASQSHIVSPQVLPYIWRTKFSTLIRDVATTATQDPVFSIQITNAYLAFHTTEGDKEMLSTLVPAVAIRTFCRRGTILLKRGPGAVAGVVGIEVGVVSG